MAANLEQDPEIAELLRGPRVSPWVATGRRYQRLLVGGATIVVLLFLWQALANAHLVNRIFISSPNDILGAMIQLIESGELWKHILMSFEEFIFGFALAVIIGIPIGVGLGWSKVFGMMLEPLISAVYAMPRIALAPLIIMWFGIGLKSKLVMVVSTAIFPIIINTADGYQNIDLALIEMSRAFKASRMQLFFKIGVPSSLPFVFAGLRLAVGLGLIGMVIGEMQGSTVGLGYMINLAGATFQTDRIFVGLFWLAMGGVVLTELVHYLEKRLVFWHQDR